MKLAIMQPYFMPYLGYWQLLSVSDKFVLYDDVSYRKGGWINRNRILIDGQPTYITIPLRGASPNRSICELQIIESDRWRAKLLKSIAHAYRSADFFDEVYPIIQMIIEHESQGLAEFLVNHFEVINKFLDIDTVLVNTSRIYGNRELRGQERVIDICEKESADVYINLEGGMNLYDFREFARKNVSLKFLRMNPVPYQQKSQKFVPFMSVLDALMSIGKVGVRELLSRFTLIES